jgi:tetratricopeptide (TPR) repeat protein
MTTGEHGNDVSIMTQSTHHLVAHGHATIQVLNHPMEIKESDSPPLPAHAHNSEDPNNEYEACEQLLANAVHMKWQQNYQIAHQVTTYCIENYSDYYHAYFQNGLTYHSMQKPIEAIQSFKRCIACKKIPKAYTHIAGGWIAYLEKRTEEAEKEFELAIEADPKCSYAYFSRGYVQDVQKKLELAVESFHQALACTPRYSPCGVYNNIAWCYEQMTGKRDEAYLYYTKAIECNPTFVRALYNRAKLQQERKQIPEAIKDLEAILKINKTHLYSYLELGDIYWFDMNDRDTAMKYYEISKNVIDPTNCYAYLLIASIYSYEKDYQKAIAELDKGLRYCHRNDFIIELLKKKIQYSEKYIKVLQKQVDEEEEKTASQPQTPAPASPNRRGLTIQIAKKDSPQHKRQLIQRLIRMMEKDNEAINFQSVDNFYCAKMKARLKAILFVPFNVPSSPVPYTPPSLLKKPFNLQRDIFDVITPTPFSGSSLTPNPFNTNSAPSPVVGDPVDYKYYVYYFYDAHNAKLSSVWFSDIEILIYG